MKGIFDTRSDSQYDDDIVRRYHFPNRYLAEAQKTIGDWIVYREPRRGGGREGYVAVAKVVKIDPDPAASDHSYAIVDGFLPFERVVAFRGPAGFRESQLRLLPEAAQVGAALRGRSIRLLASHDFGAIVAEGLSETLSPANAVKLGLEPTNLDPATAALLVPAFDPTDRPFEQLLVNRRIRDAAFRNAVCTAYDNTCAVTGLRIVNGGGRAEVQAAHIVPVAAGGPDVVPNGIALSATAHWLFDRHLISLTDDFGLLVSHNKVPAEFRALFAKQMDRIRLPADPRFHPHMPYVRRHRELFAAA